MFKGQTRTYNANNQLVGSGFQYDGNGNPVQYRGVSLQFDVENRLLSFGNVLMAGYNGDGLRAWKQTASGRRYFLYDGEELVCELDSAGNPVAAVLFGANGLLVYGGVGYQFDPQGNATHLLDDDGRLVLAHLAYDAWGQLVSGSNPTPYGYKAQWGYHTETETGLLLLTYRYLDPATGRFLTRDPAGCEASVNLYFYVENSVVGSVDPTGEFINPAPPHRRPPIRPWPPGSPRKPCPRPHLGGIHLLPGNPRICAPYLNACNRGYVLACNMYYVCLGAGGAGWLPPIGGRGAACVRGCLLRFFGSPTLLSCWCAYAQHRECMALCGYSPPWLFDWNTWGLVCRWQLPGAPPPGRTPIPTPPGAGAPPWPCVAPP